MALRDTLESMQEQEQQNVDFENNKPAMIQERQDRIAALMHEISVYLQEYTRSGSVTIVEHECPIDDFLGRYNLAMLAIAAFGKVICVDPSGPGRIGFPDSVDVYRQDRSGNNQREVLAWLRDARRPDASFAWYVRSATPLQQPSMVQQVTRARMAPPAAVAQQRPIFELITRENFSDLVDRLLR